MPWYKSLPLRQESPEQGHRTNSAASHAAPFTKLTAA